MDKKELWQAITRTSVELNQAQIQVRILEERKKALLFELNCVEESRIEKK